MAGNLFYRYIWLVDTIYRAGKISFEEINNRWVRNEMSNGMRIPLRTFHNHRSAIEEMFDINIECSKAGGYYYYIGNAEELKKNGARSWLLSTFAVNNLIAESRDLKSRILFEEIPSGHFFLAPIIEAMRDNEILEITYQSYRKNTPTTFTVEPYCVKVFKQRWYLVARSPFYDKVLIYALDRIKDLDKTGKTFVYPKTFYPETYFDSSFGIIVNTDEKVECVKIKVYGEQSAYIRSLPLHSSQKEVETTDEYAVFEYMLRPTYDFVQELLSHGSNIEVLSPIVLREQVSQIVREMMGRYSYK
jgi:hypothetical protein